jgi:hypothetical protein
VADGRKQDWSLSRPKKDLLASLVRRKRPDATPDVPHQPKKKTGQVILQSFYITPNHRPCPSLLCCFLKQEEIGYIRHFSTLIRGKGSQLTCVSGSWTLLLDFKSHRPLDGPRNPSRPSIFSKSTSPFLPLSPLPRSAPPFLTLLRLGLPDPATPSSKNGFRTDSDALAGDCARFFPPSTGRRSSLLHLQGQETGTQGGPPAVPEGPPAGQQAPTAGGDQAAGPEGPPAQSTGPTDGSPATSAMYVGTPEEYLAGAANVAPLCEMAEPGARAMLAQGLSATRAK